MGIRYFSSSSRKVSPRGWPNEEEFDEEDPFNRRSNEQKEEEQRPVKLTHVNQNGTAHMVAVSNKRPTHRTAFAVSTVRFSKPEPLRLIKQNAIKKGDVLSVARIAGIMAAKQTPTIIPLCHNIDITHAEVEAGLIEPPPAENSSASTTTSRDNEEEAYDNDDDEPSPLTHHRPESRARLYSTSHLSPGDPRAVADASAYPFGGVMLTARVETTGRTGVEMDALHAASAAALTVYDMCKAVDKAMSLQNARVVLKTGGKSGDWVDVGWLFARAGVVRSRQLEGLMTTAGGAVDEGVRRAVAEIVAKEAEEGGEGGLARREWKKCYRVLTRSGWEPEKAMQLLSWIPRKAYSPASVENGGAEGVEGEEGVAAAAAAAAAAEAEALEEEMVVEEDDVEALEEEMEEEEELVVEEEEDAEDLEELAAEDYATILEQQLRKELEELEREEFLDEEEEGEADDVEEEVLEDDQPPVPASANNKGVQKGSVGRQEEQQQSARMEEEKEDTEPAPPSTTTTTSSETSPSPSAPTTAATSAGGHLKKPVETTMALFDDAHMADADSNQNPLLTASMIRQMSPRDLFADNARSSGKRREFQTKAQKIQEEEVEEEVDQEVDEESDREFEEEVRQQKKEYFEQKARAYREQRKIRRRERKEAIKQEKRDLKREKEQEKKKRLAQLLALEAEEMRRNRLEAQVEAEAIVRKKPANVLRNSEGKENEEEAAIRNSFYTTPLRRPTQSFHYDPEGFIAAAERRSKDDRRDGIGFALPQVQPTAQDIKRAQKSRASTEPMPEHLKDPAERLERKRWLRDGMWDKRMEKLAALDRMVAAARCSPKYSPHWNRALSQGGRAMVTLALAAKIGVHSSRYDILQWTPPGLDDDDVEVVQKVGEEELRASWERFVKTRPPKMTWKYMQLKKEGVETKYVLRHRVMDEKERLKRAMGRVDYNEWCLLNGVMEKRERRWAREAEFAEVEERAQEDTRKVLSTPAPGEAWYDQLLEEMEDDVKDDAKDEGKTESVSDESSNAREDGSDEFDELQSLIDKKSKMTEGKEGAKGKKGKKGKGKRG